MLQKDQLEFISNILETYPIKTTLWMQTWNSVREEIRDIEILTQDKRREEAEDADRSEIEALVGEDLEDMGLLEHLEEQE